MRRNLSPQNDPLAVVTEKYAVAVTDEVMATINASDPHDPVARQYLPSIEELKTTPNELEDPIGDEAHSPVKGIVHRYPDRVLLKAVHVCAVYCRFCFRREKVGPGSEMLTADELAAALGYIRDTAAIWEVILTGGDPFVLSPRRLQSIMDELNKIDHVKVIRFHTRVPIADPTRVTPGLVAALKSDKAVYVVVHTNHANELTDKVRAAVSALIDAGIPLLSQSTLLAGVNDTAETLEKLFRRLVEMRIKPYYLHHPDRAPGTGHFRLSIARGQALVRALLGRLSGIAQPHYMLDIPGGHGKVPLNPPRLAREENGYTVTDYTGKTHAYPDEA